MSIATNCINDILFKIDALELFGKKLFATYSEEDLLDKAKILSLPAVGIVYQGIFASDGQDPSRQGLMGTLKVTIVLVIDGKSIAKIDRKDVAADYLDSIRSAILTTKSPTKHKWKFTSESPVGPMGSVYVYLQTWETATPLTN